jgi:Na+-driven multidrug efflux pump/anti-sigma regulatory factor (Ser/Thr protein kinase)
MFKTKSIDPIIFRLFRDALSVAVVFELSSAIACIIDGMMVSIFLGSEAITAQEMAHPYFSIAGVISGMLATGMQICCSKSMGKGDMEETNCFFSTTIAWTIGLSLLAMTLGYCFIDSVVSFLGGTGALFSLIKQYLSGLMPGLPALIGMSVLSPVMQLDGEKRRSQIAFLLYAGLNLAGDGLNLFVFHGGLFGMGLTTAIAGYLAVGYLLLHFFRKNALFHFTVIRLQPVMVKNVMTSGFPRVTKRLCNFIRPIFLNRWVLFIGTSTAMAAMAVQNSLRDFILLPSSAVSSAVLLITAVMYGDEDQSALRQLLTLAMRYNTMLNFSMMTVLLIAAPQIAAFYIRDSAEICALAGVAIRLYAISVPFNAFNEYFINYMHGIQRLKFVHVLALLQRVLLPLLCAWIGGVCWGVVGIFASFVMSESLLSLIILILVTLRNKKIPCSIQDLLLLPKNFGVSAQDCLEFSVTNMNEVIGISMEIGSFCQAHNIDKRRSFFLSLAIEEMAGNVVKHGFCDGKKHHLSIRVYIENDNLHLRLRDDCPLFDVKKQIEKASTADHFANIGIRLVMGISKDVSYINTLNTNNLSVTL